MLIAEYFSRNHLGNGSSRKQPSCIEKSDQGRFYGSGKTQIYQTNLYYFMHITTIDYYNKNWKDFTGQTGSLNFSEIEDRFLKYVKAEGTILDFGCGSGRDTKYFLEHGYKVDAVDGSSEICRAASEYTGIHVRQMLFQDLYVFNKYDGIWACASILHLPKAELPQMFCRMRDALKECGILYVSFKYGEFEGERNGRFFTDLTEENLKEIVNQVQGLMLRDLWITQDVRKEREQQRWINAIFQKSSAS